MCLPEESNALNNAENSRDFFFNRRYGTVISFIKKNHYDGPVANVSEGRKIRSGKYSLEALAVFWVSNVEVSTKSAIVQVGRRKEP